jgi:predicted RND superfamily exporter protein
VVRRLEDVVFRHRGKILLALGLVTAAMFYFATQLRMDAGFAKQLPRDHEYIETFFEYRTRLFGSDRVMVVLRAKDGDIWNPAFMKKLQELTDSVFFLPGVDRRTVTSLWTPNTRYFEITEDGMIADDVVPSSVLPDRMTEADVDLIRDKVIKGGYVGRLVANDYTAAMVTAELLDVDPRTGLDFDYLELAASLEADIRAPHEDAEYDVHLLGFVKQMGDIADGARSVAVFFVLAFLFTTAAVYFYARSWVLTFLPLFCSLVSVVWQFATIHLLGFGLDPLAVLVPFLVFAIGVSHGVQQINLISRHVCDGEDSLAAARHSFSELLIPGSMALITDLVGFGTLVLIPIAMIQELGITALIGVSFKIITNLFMLPLLASYFSYDHGYKARITRARQRREAITRRLGVIAEPRHAYRAVAVFAVIFALAVWQSQGRHVGDLHAGSPELRPNSRYNFDARTIVSKFSLGLDVLVAIVETPEQACIDYDSMQYLNDFGWHMENVPGVLSVVSAPNIAKLTNAAWSEGNPKWKALPRNRYSLGRAVGSLDESSGLLNVECSLMPIFVFTADHKAETIKQVVGAAEDFRRENPYEGIRIRLASGNVGVQAAINEVLERSETPMMTYVYLAIIGLVLLTYRDWRATICCCVPLTLATFLGYWFMKELEIGLKVATMPVMVLAVGLGVDYAFYIYNRMQAHLAAGEDITAAYKLTVVETGTAVIFTAVTLAVGVFTWSLSDLKFQADMGILLSFMFMINMVMAVTALPALAVVIDRLVPRRKPVRVIDLGH